MKKYLVIVGLSVAMFLGTLGTKVGVVRAEAGVITLSIDKNISDLVTEEDVIESFINIDFEVDMFWDLPYTISDNPQINQRGHELGIQFEGWSFTEDATSPDILPNGQLTEAIIPEPTRTELKTNGGSLTLYAVFSRPSYTVTIKNTGASSDPQYTVKHGDLVDSIPTPVNQDPFFGGPVFNGYLIEGTQTEFDALTPITSDLVLEAQWKDYEIVLEHHANIEPSLAPQESSIFIDISMPSSIVMNTFDIQVGSAPSITPIGEDLGVKFEGWSLIEGDDSNLISAGQIIDETYVDMNDYQKGGVIHLYAIYSRPSYTVTIKDTANSVGRPFVIYHGELFESLNYTPSNGVNVFEGYTIEGTQVAFDPSTKIKQDYTLVGNWSTPSTPPLKDLETTITWVGGNSPRPNVTVSILNGNSLIETQTVVDGTTSIVWKSMPEFDGSNNPIIYNVTATKVNNYTISYSGLNVILTYNEGNVAPNPNLPQDPILPQNPEEADPSRPTAVLPAVLPATGIESNLNIAYLFLLIGFGLIVIRRKESLK